MEFFNQQALATAIDHFFQQRRPLNCPVNLEKYTLREAFGEQPYWEGTVRGSRFEQTLSGGILYRPQIVNEIRSKIDAALNMGLRSGVMVKGPHGVGKAHSLVNTVLRLESTGDYLVTFFPDCQYWNNFHQFVDQICASFGATKESVGLGFNKLITVPETLRDAFVDELINLVSTELTARGKKWVFVFDQINKLFVKPMNLQAKDASGLAFPFHLIQTVQKPGHITSVISASANNEMAYKERHEGFVEYVHRTSMTNDELCLTFDINEQTVQDVVDYSGGVPLYALLYVQDPGRFQAEVNRSLLYSLDRLRPKSAYELPEWQLVLESIFSSLFGTTSSSEKYDKKFLIREEAIAAGNRWRYRPLFPAVLSAYRKHLWRELMAFVEEKEGHLLEICRSEDTTNDTRGRLFEHIVIRRCQSSGVGIQVADGRMEIGAGSEHVDGRLLPTLTATSPNRVYIPIDPNFPAIDIIWKHDRSIFGVQVHVSSHDDVASCFSGLCRKAGWFQNFDTVYLVYLGPEDAVTNLVSNLVEPPNFETRVTRSTNNETERYRIIRRAISKDSVLCLSDLQWPEGCSLP